MNADFQSQKKFLLIPHYRLLTWISGGTLVAWTAWGVVLLKLDPYSSTSLALTLFLVSFFIALSGTFTLLMSLIKKWRTRDQLYIKHILISLRQGILLSLCTTLCAGLLVLGFLRIWNGLLLVILMMLIEFYLSGKDEL